MGHVFQTLDTNFIGRTVLEEVELGCRQAGEPPEKARGILERYDLLPLASQSPLDLSVGQRRLLCLATYAAASFALLVLDEPSLGLDSRGFARLLGVLRGMRDEGRALVLVTHEPRLLTDLVDRVVVVADGRVAKSVSVHEALSLGAEVRSLPQPPLFTLGRTLRGDTAPFPLSVDAFADALVR